ncbi:MAG TPA: AAA family ATPase [Mycobacterium sp.]|nr:AAA family ATPase [Mycobacterium sp.]
MTDVPAGITDLEQHAIATEQPIVDDIHDRLEQLRDQARERLSRTLTAESASSQGQSERDAHATRDQARIGAFDAAERRLVFGRLDVTTGRRYIGRIGLRDDNQENLLIDWRAEAAQPFYRATAANPGGVLRRRHLSLSGRRVVRVHDDLIAAEVTDAVPTAADAPLLDAVNRPRTDRMHDIVTTIQAEQDEIIRQPLPGILVIEGGPGTGKTVVALHRTAWLMHQYRDRLERTGVLLIGPNARFLHYIDEVLPSLGETNVVTATIGELYPGVATSKTDTPDIAAIKDSERMVEILQNLVRAQQQTPQNAIVLDIDGTEIALSPAAVAQAQAAARATAEPHNIARETFCAHILDNLAQQLTSAEDDGVTQPPPLEEILQRLRQSRDVRREINLCWMPRRPEELLARIWNDPALLVDCSPDLSAEERQLLLRNDGEATEWTVNDVPLLEELAELLGPMPASTRARAERARQEAEADERRRFALESLSSLGLEGAVDAGLLADRFADARATSTVAERALNDREWTFGHIVVDEAQELSTMAWRMLLRRNPSRSMTVVGDLNQATTAHAIDDWSSVFDSLAPGRWRRCRLSVNYRAPGAITDLATTVLQASGRTVSPVRSLRTGQPPTVRTATHLRRELEATLEEVHRRPGAHAVIAPPQLQDIGRTQVFTAEEVKGLEFDHVVLLEPTAFLDGSLRGHQALYVALTRATQSLTVLHQRPLPAGWIKPHTTRAPDRPED